jgi:MSHA biogenesis protein MshI
MRIPSISSLLGAKSLSGGRLAVALGAHGVYLAEIKSGGERPRVKRCEYHETGAVSAAALERVCREAGVGGHHCTTLLMSGEYQLLLVEAPNVPEEELKTAVRWKIKDSLSYPVDNATVDVLRVPGAGRAQLLYAVAAPGDIIGKRMALFGEAKLKLDVIDIPEMAQRNIAAHYEQEGRTLVLLAFDDEGALLTFTSEGELCMARRIDISAGQLQDADDSLRDQARDRIELELQRSLDYFDRQFSHAPVGRILVSAPDDGAAFEFLASAMGGKVERLDLSQALDIGAVPELAESGFAALALPALGAALRHEGGG